MNSVWRCRRDGAPLAGLRLPAAAPWTQCGDAGRADEREHLAGL